MITLGVGFFFFFGAWCSLLAVVPVCWLQPVSQDYLKPIQEKCYTVQNITA